MFKIKVYTLTDWWVIQLCCSVVIASLISSTELFDQDPWVTVWMVWPKVGFTLCEWLVSEDLSLCQSVSIWANAIRKQFKLQFYLPCISLKDTFVAFDRLNSPLFAIFLFVSSCRLIVRQREMNHKKAATMSTPQLCSNFISIIICSTLESVYIWSVNAIQACILFNSGGQRLLFYRGLRATTSQFFYV